ncbi:MAG: hypothetical protein GY863_08270 [bacterium]|nr:hypothetical protein [bacterium]
MSDVAEIIAENIVENADKEEIIFARSSKIDNMMQLIYEQRVTIDDIDEAIMQTAKDDRKKFLLYFSNELAGYLSAKLSKLRASGYRSQPKTAGGKEEKKSKSDKFFEERKRKQAEKEAKERKGEGTIEKIGIKEIGKELQEQKEQAEQLEEKRLEQQSIVEDEQARHIASYKMVFGLHAYAIEVTVSENTEELRELIKKIGDSDITSRQVALDKLSRHPQAKFAVDALIACLGDKNIIIPVVSALHNVGQKKSIKPLINLIKEYPTSNDIMFRGPAISAIGETVKQMNGQAKSSGIKYIYTISSNPKFEKVLKVLIRILTKDISDSKIRSKYFTPQCFKWMAMITDKIIEIKKKKVKVGFVNVTVQTDFSKELKEFSALLKKSG